MGRPSWTHEQLDLLRHVMATCADDHGRITWENYAEMIGHGAVACSLKAHKLRKQAGEAKRRPPKEKKDRPKRAPATSPEPDIPFTRGPSTYRHAIDAEMWRRIETQGPTAGLFGDPLPGRSALDQKRTASPAK